MQNYSSFMREPDPLNISSKTQLYHFKWSNPIAQEKKIDQQTHKKQLKKQYSNPDFQKLALKNIEKLDKDTHQNISLVKKVKECPSFILTKHKSSGDLIAKISQNYSKNIQSKYHNQRKTQDFSKCQIPQSETEHSKNPQSYHIQIMTLNTLKSPNNLSKFSNLGALSTATSSFISMNENSKALIKLDQQNKKRPTFLSIQNINQQNQYKSKSFSKIQTTHHTPQSIKQPKTPTTSFKLKLSKSNQKLILRINVEKLTKQLNQLKEDSNICKQEGQYWKKKFQNKNQIKQLHINDFEFLSKLGKGSYGSVYLAKQKKSNFICAVKKISKKMIKSNKLEQQLIRQIKIQAYIHHQNIVSLYKVLSDLQYIYLMMQYIPGSDLSKQLDKFHKNEHQTALVIQQICRGVSYLHQQGIIHRDLKPQNIFIYQQNIKIGDFGCAVNGPGLRSTFVGCVAYLSPQQLKQQAYRQKIDIWSIGIMTYQMLMGRCPFEEDIVNILRKQKEAKLGKINFNDDLWLSQECQQFILKMLKQNPKERMSVQQALNHKFLKKNRQYYEAANNKEQNYSKKRFNRQKSSQM